MLHRRDEAIGKLEPSSRLRVIVRVPQHGSVFRSEQRKGDDTVAEQSHPEEYTLFYRDTRGPRICPSRTTEFGP
jgi:hypothetical protein